MIATKLSPTFMIIFVLFGCNLLYGNESASLSKKVRSREENRKDVNVRLATNAVEESNVKIKRSLNVKRSDVSEDYGKIVEGKYIIKSSK